MWAAILMGLANAGMSLWQSSSQNQAQAASKKDAKKVNKANYQRALLEYDIDWASQGSAFAADLARIAAMKFQERQKESDYNWRQDEIVDQALNNLQLNSSAIYDKYGLEEGLRAAQARLKLRDAVEKNQIRADELVSNRRALSIQSESETNKAATTKREINLNARKLNSEQDAADFAYDTKRRQLAHQAAINTAQTSQQVYELLQASRAKRRQAEMLNSRTEQEGQNLMTQQTLDMQQKLLERDFASIESAFSAASARATASVRSGGAATARRVAMNAAQQFGRTYAQIQQVKQQQVAQLGAFNAEVQGTKAMEMMQLAKDMQTMASRSARAIKIQKTQNKSLKREQLNIINQRNESLDVFAYQRKLLGNTAQEATDSLRTAKQKMRQQYGTVKRNNLALKQNYNMLEKMHNKLTLPSFAMNQRQGVRDMTGLYLNTKNMISQASTPFRKSIIMDPHEPIRGLPPEKLTPRFGGTQNPMNQYANALIGGVDQALRMGEWTSSGFRFS